jgi:hypothetical protein
MQLSFFRRGLAAALMFLPVVVAAESTLKKSYSDNELVEILQSDGYRAVEVFNFSAREFQQFLVKSDKSQ